MKKDYKAHAKIYSNASKMKKGLELSFTIMITLVLGLLVIILVFPYVAKKIFGTLDFIPFFRSPNKTIIPSENHIEKEEKSLEEKRYPSVRLIYKDWGDPNLFSFRWNPNINQPEGDVQVALNIDNDADKIDTEWRTIPENFPAFSTLEPREKAFIQRIANAKSEDEMFREISEISKTEDYYIDFPQSDYNRLPTTSYKKQALSGEEIKENLYCILEEVTLGAKKISETKENAPDIAVAEKPELTSKASSKCQLHSIAYQIYQEDGERKITQRSGVYSQQAKTMNFGQPFAFVNSKNQAEYTSLLYRISIRCSNCEVYASPVSFFKDKTYYFKLI